MKYESYNKKLNLCVATRVHGKATTEQNKSVEGDEGNQLMLFAMKISKS